MRTIAGATKGALASARPDVNRSPATVGPRPGVIGRCAVKVPTAVRAPREADVLTAVTVIVPLVVMVTVRSVRTVIVLSVGTGSVPSVVMVTGRSATTVIVPSAETGSDRSVRTGTARFVATGALGPSTGTDDRPAAMAATGPSPGMDDPPRAIAGRVPARPGASIAKTRVQPVRLRTDVSVGRRSPKTSPHSTSRVQRATS